MWGISVRLQHESLWSGQVLSSNKLSSVMVRYCQTFVLCGADRVGVDLPPMSLQLVDVNDVVQLM